MNTTEEQQLQQLVGQLETVPAHQLQQKLAKILKCPSTGLCCSLEDFAIYFLAALRQNTEHHFRSSELDTPKCETPVRKVNPSAAKRLPMTPEPNLNESQNSVSNVSSSTASSFQHSNVSTPMRNTSNQQQGRRSGAAQFCSTPQSSERANRSCVGNNSFCLGDFISQASPSVHSSRSQKKKTTIQPQTATAQDTATTTGNKPKRRVLPMTISKNVSNSSFGEGPLGTGTSSFSNENNLWGLSHSTELMDRSQSSLIELEARKSLLLRKQEIKNEAAVATERKHSMTELEDEQQATALLPWETVNLTDIPNAKHLLILATVYAQLIDSNLVANVLSELSYIIQLLSIPRSNPASSPQEPETESQFSLLCSLKNCVYFALKVLELQKPLLLQLDRKSLTVLLQNERISLLTKCTHVVLEQACQLKQRQASNENALDIITATTNVGDSKQNVYYQHDKDSRDHFPTQNEFSAFKTQRDLFYKAFKHWDLNHLSRTFNFKSELSPKIRDIFKQSEHSVNMAHLAKLFVSQLLISASETTESPEELGLKLDQLRLNRLAQRLITSNSSVEDQFPRTQAFFRDFLDECGSVSFLMQLKLALYVQLLRYNDSTYELVQLHFGRKEALESAVIEQDETAQQISGPYIVRAPVLASMLILAKFLGYVTALPYNREGTQSGTSMVTSSIQQQLQLRSHFQSDFDLCKILVDAMKQGKLLITLPWLVQYLIMLDLVTLQLKDNEATLELLYALYASVQINVQHKNLQPSAVFIVRSAIGWLLEAQPPLASNYYKYRVHSESIAPQVEECLGSLRTCGNPATKQRSGSTVTQTKFHIEPLLEHLKPIACPFLAEFRVAITPSRHAQSTSRSGRFRYITTRLEQFSSVKNQPTDGGDTKIATNGATSLNIADQQQRKLTEAFLHSQNASMRRLLEFVTERSFKCVVKDAQQQILLPSKAQADAQVNAITSVQQKVVYNDVKRIYSQACSKACQDWNEQVHGMLEQRIQQSLQALLPANTNDVVQRTYVHLIRNRAKPQLQQWLQSNVLQSNFYCSDLHELSVKVCKANKNNAGAPSQTSSTTTELCLNTNAGVSFSDLLCELQQWLHCTSLRPDFMRSYADLLELLKRAQVAVQQPQLPTIFYYLIGSGLVRLAQLLILRHSQLFTIELIRLLCDVWQKPQMLQLVGREPQGGTTDDTKCSPGIFDALLSVSFINEIGAKQENFALLEQLLRSMIQAGVLHIDLLNELCMPLFKENWTPPTWTALSQLLEHLAQRPNCGNNANVSATSSDISAEEEAKSHMLTEVLADLSRDLDF